MRSIMSDLHWASMAWNVIAIFMSHQLVEAMVMRMELGGSGAVSDYKSSLVDCSTNLT